MLARTAHKHKVNAQPNPFCAFHQLPSFCRGFWWVAAVSCAPAGPPLNVSTTSGTHLNILGPLGKAEAEVLNLACDQVLNLQIILLPIISLVNRASVDLAISLPMSVITVRALY